MLNGLHLFDLTLPGQGWSLVYTQGLVQNGQCQPLQKKLGNADCQVH